MIFSLFLFYSEEPLDFLILLFDYYMLLLISSVYFCLLSPSLLALSLAYLYCAVCDYHLSVIIRYLNIYLRLSLLFSFILSVFLFALDFRLSCVEHMRRSSLLSKCAR